MRARIAIIAIALVTVVVGVVVALPSPVTQHFPPVKRRIQITSLCDTLIVSPNTPIPDVGQEGVIRFQCSGSASAEPFKCANWSSGLDCAFYVGNSSGGGGGFVVPTFTLPAGYVHIWAKGAGVFPTNLTEAQDCSQFDDPGHWLTNGQARFLGNISHVYCAHLDANTGGMPPDGISGFDITWS